MQASVGRDVVGTGRFELPACRLGGDRSIQLSYVPTFNAHPSSGPVPSALTAVGNHFGRFPNSLPPPRAKREMADRQNKKKQRNANQLGIDAVQLIDEQGNKSMVDRLIRAIKGK